MNWELFGIFVMIIFLTSFFSVLIYGFVGDFADGSFWIMTS